MATDKKPDLLVSITAGAAAGLMVDLSLFPLDTIKTRLQSSQGFYNAGGFRGIYKGILPALIGSAPSAAVFFMTYNSLLNMMSSSNNSGAVSFKHMTAAGLAEMTSAFVRMPLEMIKQRKQTSVTNVSAGEIIRLIYKHEGLLGFYRGYSTTISRELPFGCIELPIWEYLKSFTNAQSSIEIGLCGAVAGGIAASLTTPMDVLRTRVMLADFALVSHHKTTIALYSYLIKNIWREHGVVGFFAGIVPRVMWITAGGFIYFGSYGKAVSLCERFHPRSQEKITLEVT